MRMAVTVAAVMTSGRAVLAVPFAGDFPIVGERVLVAWNASREAARALNDALPLLLTPSRSRSWQSTHTGGSASTATSRRPISPCTSPAMG